MTQFPVYRVALYDSTDFENLSLLGSLCMECYMFDITLENVPFEIYAI